MKILDVVQGSPEWLAARGCYRCASEAPAMKGASKTTTRNELLRVKAIGTDKEFSDWEQKNLIDKGHTVEAQARALVEEDIGEDLFQLTVIDEARGLLASLDGVTMDGKTGFEHKQWNQDLVVAMQVSGIPPSHYWQLEQQILVAGLERVIFVCSDGTRERREVLEYRAVPGRAKELLAGWAQFDEDLKNYQHVEDAPRPAGTSIMELPTLVIQLNGEVRDSNLPAFKAAALARLEEFNTNLQTDEDFVNADKAVKFCAAVEERLDLVRQQALEQTATIADLFRTIKQLQESYRGKRLELDRLVESRKAAIREEQRMRGVNALAAHVTKLNARLGRSYMPFTQGNFGGVMKGLRTISSIRNAVDTELARATIEANEIADRIQMNLKALSEVGADYVTLFPDEASIINKAPDDLAALIDQRKAKQDELVRERLRQQEAARTPPPAAAPAPQPTAAPEPQVTRGGVTKRPTDDEIITALAAYYNTSPGRVVVWLRDMDLTSASKRLPGNSRAA